MDKSGYGSFGNSKFSISLNLNVMGTSSLSVHDNLYLLDIVASFNESLYTSTRGTKHKLIDKDSIMLWHKRLGHISKQRIQRLVLDEILDSLHMTNFQVCIECIKGKKIKKMKLCANRCTCLRTNSYQNFWTIPHSFLEWSMVFYYVHKRIFKVWVPIFDS